MFSCFCFIIAGLADITDEHGRTPLMLAAQNRHPGVIELLTSSSSSAAASRSSGARSSPVPQRNVDVGDVYGRTAFHRAAANGHTECMKLLLEVGTLLLMLCLLKSLVASALGVQPTNP